MLLLDDEAAPLEERTFVATWQRQHFEDSPSGTGPVAVLSLIFSLIPIGLWAPMPQRDWLLAALGIPAVLMGARLLLKARGVGETRYLLLLSGSAMVLSTAAAMAAAFTARVEVVTVAFLPALYYSFMIFAILLFPYASWLVMPLSALYVIAGAHGLSAHPDFPFGPSLAAMGSCASFAVMTYYTRVYRMRREASAEFKTRNLMLHNQKLQMENYERELEIARRIQDSLAMPDRMSFRGGEAVFYQQKHGLLGGDWLAARRLPSEDLAILVADATGKGVGAALVVHAVQSLWVSALNHPDFDPQAWLSTVNRTLLAMGRTTPHTMSLGLVIISASRLVFYSAGHLPLFLVYRHDNGKEEVKALMAHGTLLGIRADLALEARRLELAVRRPEFILLGTDGVFHKGTFTPKSWIQSLLRSIEAEGEDALAHCPARDDKILVQVRLEAPALPLGIRQATY